jgi:DNA modification methylase
VTSALPFGFLIRENVVCRGNPEGDSIIEKEKGKIRAPPNSDNDSSFDVVSPSKKRKTHINPDPLENMYVILG